MGYGELPYKLIHGVVTHSTIGHSAGFIQHIDGEVDIAIVIDAAVIQLDIGFKEAQIIDVLLAADYLGLTVIVPRSDLQLTTQHFFLGLAVSRQVNLADFSPGILLDTQLYIQQIAGFFIFTSDIGVDKAFIKV